MAKRKEHQQVSALDVLWSLASSSTFGLMVGLIALLWLLMGTQVPQNEVPAPLYGIFRYGSGLAIENLGIYQVLRSWVLGFLLVLGCLALVARLMETSDKRGMGRVLDVVELPQLTPVELGGWLKSNVGIRRWGEERGSIHGIRGLFQEGGLLVILGIGMLLVGNAVGWNDVTERVFMQSDVENPTLFSVHKTELKGNRAWVEGEVDFDLKCSALGANGPGAVLDCTLTHGKTSLTGTLAAGQTWETPIGTFRARSFRRLPNRVGRFSVEDGLEGPPAIQDAVLGKAYTVGLGQGKDSRTLRLSPLLRNGGTFASVENTTDNSMWVMADLPLPENAAPPAFIRMDGSPEWTIERLENRWNWWFQGAAGLLFLGLLLVTFVPHLRMEAVLREDGRYLARLSSLNRPFLPEKLRHKLEKRDER